MARNTTYVLGVHTVQTQLQGLTSTATVKKVLVLRHTPSWIGLILSVNYWAGLLGGWGPYM